MSKTTNDIEKLTEVCRWMGEELGRLTIFSDKLLGRIQALELCDTKRDLEIRKLALDLGPKLTDESLKMAGKVLAFLEGGNE